jgi:CheY-like chemotaxis protein
MAARRVLLVEDNETIRALMKLLLSFAHEPLDIWEASNGEEGILVCRQFFPELVITDLDMPVMNGIEMIQFLRSEPDKRLSRVPIIVTTGTSAEWQHKCIEAGANMVLEKPVSRRELMLVLANLLHSK